MMKQKNKLLLLAVIAALAIPLIFAGTASAKYVGDGAVPNPVTGGWDLPADKGFCVTSVKSDGTMFVDLSVGNSRPDCLATIFPAYTTQNACIDNNGTNPEGSHYWTSTCIVTGSNPAVAISLSGLDRTRYMCEQNGGTWKSACTGNWTAMGPTWSAAPVAVTTGGTDGFCYTRIRIADYADNNACLTGGTYPADNTIKFGYKWGSESGSNQCTYEYGISGPFGGTVSRTGTYSATAKNMRGVVTATAGDTIDLSAKTQGQCQFDGFSFSNHTTKGGTAVVGASTIATPITQVRAGCLSCHNNTTQYNGYAGRWKSDYLKQGHKNMLRKVTSGQNWAGPNADGVIEIYTSAAAGQTLHFDNATATGSFGNKPLMYLFGDWMAPAPGGLDTVIWDVTTAKYNGGSGYSCAACHTTGWRNEDQTKGLCTVSSATTQAACTTAGGTWYPSSGSQGYGKGGEQPGASFTGYRKGGSAFDNNSIPGITGQWDHDGINCNRCHKVAYDPTLPLNNNGVNAPPDYTTHETDIFSGEIIVNTCFGCHQSIANENNGIGTNKDIADATKIPVKNTATAPAYVPEWNSHVIGASFLNSPHGKYTGGIVPNALGKYDLAPGGTFASTFKGKVCRSSTTVGGGSILETKADGHVIANLEECNVANGKTTNLDNNFGYWQDETGPGNCTTCHNVHESLFVADAKEPLRRECTTCHTDKLVNDMRHPLAGNTPDGLSGGNHAKACEICHMPKATSGGFPMHLWRVNSSPSYRTFPTAAEFGIGGTATKKVGNTSPDGAYANAVWVDVDYACGQCHGGGPNQANPVYATPITTAPYFDKNTLAAFAAGIHLNQTTNAPPVATAAAAPAVSGFNVTFTDASTDDAAFPPLAITVNWGDGSPWDNQAAGSVFSHTYAATGSYTIILTARDAGGLYNSKFYPVTVLGSAFSISGTIFDAGGGTINNAIVTLKRNGATKASLKTPVAGTYSFSNLSPGFYTVQVYKSGMVFDGDPAPGQQNPITVMLSGSVTKDFTQVPTFRITVDTGSPGVSGATVFLRKGGVLKATATTSGTGTKVFNNVAPGTYEVSVSKTGVIFSAPVTVTGPGDQTASFTHTP